IPTAPGASLCSFAALQRDVPVTPSRNPTCAGALPSGKDSSLFSGYLVCNRTFDKYSCWPDAQLNSTVNVSCPWYLPWYDQGTVFHGYVFKKCGPDGQWVTGPGGKSLRNADQCMIDNKEDQPMFLIYILAYNKDFAVRTRSTSCFSGQNNRDGRHVGALMHAPYRPLRKGVKSIVDSLRLKFLGLSFFLTPSFLQVAAGCQAATVFMQYGIVANYCWLLVEGIYLYNLLVLTVFSERSYFTLYLCIGWGELLKNKNLFPFSFFLSFFLHPSPSCWSTNNNMGFWWILRFPVFLAILVSPHFFLFFVETMGAKCSVQNCIVFSCVLYMLAKSTLTLIPLLGIHEMVFAFVIDEQAQGTLRFVKLFFDLFLGSFQGMLVAILYCFVNKEVQSELTKKWSRWKLGRDIEEEYKHTYSNTPNARNGRNSSTCKKHKLVGNYVNGLSCSQATIHTSTQYLERTCCSISENPVVNELPPCYEFPDMRGESNI
uniref:Glucagon receptor n=1 Tax=Laticauda laticaudata TaxID=8630 RepID=A0A8C5SWI5_LATLA